MIKLIVSDLDGTLLDEDHVTVPAINADALWKAHERGKKIVVATGRTYSISKHIIEQLPCDYVIISNGAVALDMSNGEALTRAEIPGGKGAEILQMLKKTGSVHSVFCGQNVYMEKQYADEFIQAIDAATFSARLLSGMMLVSDVLAAINGRDIEKIDIHNLKNADRQRFLQDALNISGWNFSSSYYGGNIEITAPEATKGKALEALCGRLQIARAEVMAFGDSDNDIDMLRWAAYSFAMDNAAPEIKKAAAYTAAANTEGGVGLAIAACLEKESE